MVPYLHDLFYNYENINNFADDDHDNYREDLDCWYKLAIKNEQMIFEPS